MAKDFNQAIIMVTLPETLNYVPHQAGSPSRALQ